MMQGKYSLLVVEHQLLQLILYSLTTLELLAVSGAGVEQS